jgi:hypothetical protein
MTHVDCTRIGDEMIELLMGVVFAYEMMMMMINESNDKAEKLFRSFSEVPWQAELQSLSTHSSYISSLH